jgi:putative FmdB family regulatory protein
MPIYEYRCNSCSRKMTYLVLTPASFQPVCKYCQGKDLEQLYSRFAMPKSEERRLESLADPSTFSGLDENDPASVARWMKKMGKEMGEDFGGEDIDQIAEEAAQEAAGGSGMDAGADPTMASGPGLPGPSDDL